MNNIIYVANFADYCVSYSIVDLPFCFRISVFDTFSDALSAGCHKLSYVCTTENIDNLS